MRYLSNTRKVLEESRSKWPTSLYKVPGMLEWIVVATQPAQIEDIRKAPENVLSSTLALNEILQTQYTLGQNISENPYHIPIIRAQLTRAIPILVPEVYDEIVEAFRDLIPLTEDWSRVKTLETSMKVISRASNRIFVGLPLCRDSEWIDLSIQFTMDVVQTGNTLRLFPSFLRPFVNKVISRVGRRIGKGLNMLQSSITDRKIAIRERGTDHSDKPVDLLSWLIDGAKGPALEDWDLTSRILTTNFAAIHTSSMTLTHALYYLGAYPEYLPALRNEVERVTTREGWSKTALDQMIGIDSFMKESQRLRPMAIHLMERVAVEDYKFSDGTPIPAGTKITVDLNTHTSSKFFEDPFKFDGFRFVKMKERAKASGQVDKKFDMVTTGIDSLAFGHGRHACPGRYFAASELKLIMAYLVLHYDVTTVEEGVRPEDLYFVQNRVPNPTAELLFRRRKM